MPTQVTDPSDPLFLVSLRPDGLIREQDRKHENRLNLPGLFAEEGPYVTLRFGWGAEMHYHPASTGEPNAPSAALAELCGYDRVDIRGTVHFTDSSEESDSAPGMDIDAYCDTLDTLDEACRRRGIRLWRQYAPQDTVLVRPADYAPGDTLWVLGQPQRFRGLVDYPADSKTAEMFPGVQYFLCDGGFKVTASGVYPTRADRAPAGYWQRTGNQLLPAAD